VVYHKHSPHYRADSPGDLPEASRRSRPATFAVLVSAGLAFAAAPLPAAAGTAAPVSVRVLTSAQSSVTLVTGDVVTATPSLSGPATYTVSSASGGSGAFFSYQGAGGDSYVIPAAAQPYVGRQLDPSFFDVSALIRDGLTNGARIPVRLQYTHGTTPAAPDGVTLTSVRGSSARGYVTAASGATLTAALQSPRNGTTGAAPLAGLTSMSLDLPTTPAATATTTPTTNSGAGPLQILQLNALDGTGSPAASASVFLADADQSNLETIEVPIVAGVARIAVPAGHYSAFASFTSQNADGSPVYQVADTDLTVPTGTTVTTATIDARTATSKISATTPKAAVRDSLGVTYYRADPNGLIIQDYHWQLAATGDIFVSPQAAPAVGALHFLVTWGGTSPTATDAYRYDLAFPADHVPADEAYTVAPEQVATVQENVSTDPLGTGTARLATVPVLPFTSIGWIQRTAAISVPTQYTDYLTTTGGGTWQQSYVSQQGVQIKGDPITVKAGNQYSIDWAHGPQTAGFGQHTGAHSCAACLAGSTLTILPATNDDSDPTHIGGDSFVSGTFALSYNGTALSSTAGYGAVISGAPTAAGTYHLMLTTNLTADRYASQSTQSVTDLTVPFDPAAPGSMLPAEDTCDGETATTPCTILPVLTLNYRLDSDTHNTSHEAQQVLRLDIGHLTYDEAGSHAPITSAAVRVSFDGGTTWQQAALTGRAGHYTATWANPTAGGTPTLQVTATDAAGGSITQTVTAAYTVALPLS
jgi:hypothetical protein